MAFGPFYSALPVDGSSRKYVDQTSWDLVITNFGSWTGDVNGGGHKISNFLLDVTSVGIGTTTPAANLDLQAASAVAYLTSTTGTNRVYQRFQNTGGNAYLGIESSAGGSLVTGSPAYATIFSIDSARSLVFGTSNTLRLLIDSAGKVGVGTASPVISSTGKFHHSGDTLRAVDASRTPANSAAAGNDGEVCMDSSYLYLHTGGSWRRAAFATF